MEPYCALFAQFLVTLLLSSFKIFSETIFGRFLIDFRPLGGTKNIEKPMVFEHFCFFSQLANKRPLDQFFGQLGLQLGVQNLPKSLPRGLQNRSKIETKNKSKNDVHFGQIFDRFSSIWASMLAPKRGGRRGVEGTFGDLVGSWGQDGPQTQQR